MSPGNRSIDLIMAEYSQDLYHSGCFVLHKNRLHLAQWWIPGECNVNRAFLHFFVPAKLKPYFCNDCHNTKCKCLDIPWFGGVYVVNNGPYR